MYSKFFTVSKKFPSYILCICASLPALRAFLGPRRRRSSWCCRASWHGPGSAGSRTRTIRFSAASRSLGKGSYCTEHIPRSSRKVFSKDEDSFSFRGATTYWTMGDSSFGRPQASPGMPELVRSCEHTHHQAFQTPRRRHADSTKERRSPRKLLIDN